MMEDKRKPSKCFQVRSFPVNSLSSEHKGQFQENSMVPTVYISKFWRSVLISQLNQSERRLKTINDYGLCVMLIYGSVDLEKALKKEVFREILAG